MQQPQSGVRAFPRAAATKEYVALAYTVHHDGMEVYSNAPMECSALRYLLKDLDDGPVKDKAIGRHSGDLFERPQTQVIIQQRQMGLGCVNSWGAWPRQEYMVPCKVQECRHQSALPVQYL